MREIERAAELRQRWLALAYEQAAIDPEHWHPRRGAEQNRATIEAVYAYYARLFLGDSRYRWAGLAAMVGPSFYAAFLDLGAVPDAVRRLGRVARRLTLATLRRGDVDREVSEALLGFLELSFLKMQRKIFDDQAVMHEAHRCGGIAAVRACHEAGLLDASTMRAWEQIDHGEPDEVDAGNRVLLWREQYTIIDRFYRQMRGYRAPLGDLATYAMTVCGAPSVPGARSFVGAYPLVLRGPLPDGEEVGLRTPLAAGNVATFADRWALIDTDTLPTFLRLLDQHPDTVDEAVRTPPAERARQWRIARRAPTLLWTGLTTWRLGVERATPQALPDAPAAASSERAEAIGVAPAEQRVVLDLTTQAAWRSAAVAAAPRAGAVLQASDAAGDPLLVRLPGETALAVSARLVLFGPARTDGRPQLVVKLPSVELDELAGQLDLVISQLGLRQPSAPPPAEQIRTADEAYRALVLSQRRLTPWCLVEVQVEHHLDEARGVIDVLVS